MARKYKKTGDRAQEKMASVIDQIAEFETYQTLILPKIRDLLAKGFKAADLYKQFRDEVAARKLTIALTEFDSTKALQAITDIENRLEGKPVERRELQHKYEGLKDEELDSLLLSEMDEMDEIDIETAEAAMESGAMPPLSDSEN